MPPMLCAGKENKASIRGKKKEDSTSSAMSEDCLMPFHPSQGGFKLFMNYNAADSEVCIRTANKSGD
jgi:hypothetical protein